MLTGKNETGTIFFLSFSFPFCSRVNVQCIRYFGNQYLSKIMYINVKHTWTERLVRLNFFFLNLKFFPKVHNMNSWHNRNIDGLLYSFDIIWQNLSFLPNLRKLTMLSGGYIFATSNILKIGLWRKTVLPTLSIYWSLHAIFITLPVLGPRST